MGSQPDAVVIVVCKAPEKGRVKTRLAADIGQEQALFVYAMMTATLFDNLAVCKDYDVCACVDGPLELVQAGSIEPLPQRGNDLGERISNAIEDCRAYAKTIVIGSDTPNITHTLINRACEVLDTTDVVIGPTIDGGYYLIGMKRLHSTLFSEIAWSTDTVCSQTLERARAANLTVSMLEIMRDIDTLDDLQAVMPELLSS